MISKFIKFITENPDTCHYDDDELNYRTIGSRPFGTLPNGTVMIGEKNDTHYEMAFPYTRDDLINAGRMWSGAKHRIISFWDLDQQTTLEIIIKKLNDTIVEDDLNFKIDKKWQIEVFNRYDYSIDFYNLFDFMKLAPYGYNNRYSAIFNNFARTNYIDRNVNINLRDFLSSYKINDNKNNK